VVVDPFVSFEEEEEEEEEEDKAIASKQILSMCLCLEKSFCLIICNNLLIKFQ